MESHSVLVKVNSFRIAANLEPRLPLVHSLREQAGLTGTHIGCDTWQCRSPAMPSQRYTSFICPPVLRRKNARMLGGCGRFSNDIRPPGVTYADVLRSSYGHALIRSIDTSRAPAMAGVIGVLTQADLAARVGVRPYTGVRLG